MLLRSLKKKKKTEIILKENTNLENDFNNNERTPVGGLPLGVEPSLNMIYL